MKKIIMSVAVGLILISTNAFAGTNCRIEMPLPGLFLPVCEDISLEVNLPNYRDTGRQHNRYSRHDWRDHKRHGRHRHHGYDRHRGPRFENDRYDHPHHEKRW